MAQIRPRRCGWLGLSMAMSHDADRLQQYRAVRVRLEHLLAGESDWIAALATVVCELHHEFSHFDWTGFYRVVSSELLVIGPYQGTHGCLRIPFARGVCGAAARTRSTQRVDQVASRADHIACSASTQSEIVVPVLAPAGHTLAVLDVDSDQEAAFGDVDQEQLEEICRDLGRRFPEGERTRHESRDP
jgi:L-methionine (R)-S-oxide reductase